MLGALCEIILIRAFSVDLRRVDRLQSDLLATDPNGVAVNDAVDADAAVTESHPAQCSGGRGLSANDLKPRQAERAGCHIFHAIRPEIRGESENECHDRQCERSAQLYPSPLGDAEDAALFEHQKVVDHPPNLLWIGIWLVNGDGPFQAIRATSTPVRRVVRRIVGWEITSVPSQPPTRFVLNGLLKLRRRKNCRAQFGWRGEER